ncbi:hypothetical protein [Clostridium perfringens]|uniref:Uncharacterized protein n=1 Tax=Clostridium perfringens B str. ATCC 3626 TaxID=451754 RepID=A0AAV3BQI5_CLOPF|nr:hypothetical protein [Clostridium perfringens]MDU2661605.1 hypothetical protein [Clostridioides difficile]EDT23848.1 hypothetical protein AC1_0663 [Clostridium perfringens B str. ATCC 3626]MDU2658332.1 hypothetical protein [Clostridium perfringens]MDU7548493.1 hypothetical protein [Clostridium perfringens]WEV05961.1 hypothetical protein PL322_03030 [Clostridium perfringens B]
MEFNAGVKLILITCIYMIFLAVEELIFNYHLKREIGEEESEENVYALPILTSAFFSLYSIFTLSYIGIYVVSLVMLKTLIVLLIKKKWKRLIHFSIRSVFYVSFLYYIYATNTPVEQLFFLKYI